MIPNCQNPNHLEEHIHHPATPEYNRAHRFLHLHKIPNYII